MAKPLRVVIVAYDIVSDRRRNKLAKLLGGFGVRVNYSVFACQVTGKAIGELKKQAAALINRREDSVLFFELCASCQTRADARGCVEQANGPVIL